jgi:replication factor A1
MLLATKHERAICGNLSIEFRGKIKNETILLITKDNDVVAQLRVDEEFLLRKDNPFESWMSSEKIRKKIAKQNTEAAFISINSLKAGMKHVNVKASVTMFPKPSQVHTQFGSSVMVVNALIGDETGTIKLCLWEGQIGTITVGDQIEVKNAQVCLFRGEKQLRLGKNGVVAILSNASQALKPQLATVQ